MEFKITKKKDEKRLDKFLSLKFPAQSRAFLKFQIKDGIFLVNNEIKKPSYELKENDIISFDEKISMDQSTGKMEPNPQIKLDVIYEDDDVIVLDKPAGLSVHPRQDKSGLPLAKESKNTLVSALLAHYPPIASVGDNPLLRPGLVHRLDKDTSGAMIVAKNQKSFEWLKNQFKEKQVRKKYIALVSGRPEKSEDTIKTFLTRSKSDPSKQKVMSMESAPKTGERFREAVTRYKVIENFPDFSLVEAHPETGRLHQIRAHFAWLGNPVAGDKKYSDKTRPIPSGLERQFLHAQELEITLPNGEKKRFFSNLPQELADILSNLNKTNRGLKD